MKEQVERAVKEGRMKPSEGVKLLDDYEAGMLEYTYLDCNGHPPPAPVAFIEPPPAAVKPVKKEREKPVAANGAEETGSDNFSRERKVV